MSSTVIIDFKTPIIEKESFAKAIAQQSYLALCNLIKSKFISKLFEALWNEQMTVIFLRLHRIELNDINDITMEFETVQYFSELLQDKRYSLQALPCSVLNDEKLVKSKFYEVLNVALSECFLNSSDNNSNTTSSFCSNVINIIHNTTPKNIFFSFNNDRNKYSKQNDSRDVDNRSKKKTECFNRKAAQHGSANIIYVRKGFVNQQQKTQQEMEEDKKVKFSEDFVYCCLLLVIELYQLFLAQKMLIYVLRELISLQGVAAWCAEYWYWAVHHEHRTSIYCALSSWTSFKSCVHCLHNRFDCKPWFRRCHLTAHYHIKELKSEFYHIVSQIGIIYSILQHVNTNISFLQNQCEECDVNAEYYCKAAETLYTCRHGSICQGALEHTKDKNKRLASTSSDVLNFSKQAKASINDNDNNIHLSIENVLLFLNSLHRDVAVLLSTQGWFTTEFKSVDNTSLCWRANSVMLHNYCEHSHFFSDNFSPLLHPSMYLNNCVSKQNDEHAEQNLNQCLFANTKDDVTIPTPSTVTSTTINNKNSNCSNVEEVNVNVNDNSISTTGEDANKMNYESYVHVTSKLRNICDTTSKNDMCNNNTFTPTINDVNNNNNNSIFSNNKSQNCEFASGENGKLFIETSKVQDDNNTLRAELFLQLTNTMDELVECARVTNLFLANKYRELRSSHHPPRARHLVRYILAASTITPVLVWFSLKPLEEIAALAQRSVAFGKMWTTEYLIQPLWQIKESLFHVRGITKAQQESFDKDAQALANIIGDYHGDYEPSKSGVALDAIRHNSYKHLREGIPDEKGYGFVYSHYRNAVRHPLLNTFFGHLPRILLIQHSYQALEISRVINGIDAVLESNDLNFKVMALVPVLLVGALCMTWLLAKWEAHYTPVKRRMKRLWRALFRLFSSPVQQTLLDESRKTRLPVRKPSIDHTRTDERRRANNNNNNNYNNNSISAHFLPSEKAHSLHEFNSAQMQSSIISPDICQRGNSTVDENNEMQDINCQAVLHEHESNEVDTRLRKQLQHQLQEQQEQEEQEEQKLQFVNHVEEELELPSELLQNDEVDMKTKSNCQTSKGWNISMMRRNSNSNCAWTDFEVGLTLLLVHIMRSMAHKYFRHYTFVPELIEDLNDLEKMELSRTDKLCVVQRMYMMHDFLKEELEHLEESVKNTNMCK